MSSTAIQWTEHVWNPTVGCSILSPGCTNCYAMNMAARIEAMNLEAEQSNKPIAAPQYDGTTKKVNGHAVWTGKLALSPERVLLQPLRRKKPTMYFVNSMSDLFHESVPDEWIDRVFAVMALCPQHTFQVLTKRAKRMREYFAKPHSAPNIDLWQSSVCWAVDDLFPSRTDQSRAARQQVMQGPLPNVWLGVSTERQQEADERIPELLQTPAAVRFISAEPLLGPINLAQAGLQIRMRDLDGPVEVNLDWVICGGESGPGARPMHPDWARALRDQCAAAGVPFFFKQWGAYQPNFPQYADEFGMEEGDMLCDGYEFPAEGVLYRDGHFYDGVEYQPHTGVGAYWMSRVGKKAAGRHLDGKLHDDMPQRGDGKGRL